jgi:hypothetical protein
MKTKQARMACIILLRLMMMIRLLDTSCQHSVFRSLTKDRPRFVVAVDLYLNHVAEEVHKLSVLENRELRGKFGSKRGNETKDR